MFKSILAFAASFPNVPMSYFVVILLFSVGPINLILTKLASLNKLHVRMWIAKNLSSVYTSSNNSLPGYMIASHVDNEIFHKPTI